MKEKTPAKRRAPLNPRRSFLVRDQLIGKMGPRGYGRLLDSLRKVAK